MAKKGGRNFPPEKEVDFNHFIKIFASHPMSNKFDSALVWEEIRSIIKGAMPQVNISVFEKALYAVKNNEINLGLIKQVQKQFILFSRLESLKVIDKFVAKYLDTDILSFSAHISRYMQEAVYKDRVYAIIDRALNTLKKQKEALDKKYLSFLEYELLGKKKAPNFKFNRKEIYHIFEWYQNKLESENKWDELDHAREVLRIYTEKDFKDYTYDILVCDEVQDFTDIQISLMFDMVQDPCNIFFAGDTKQTINPSGFRWEDVKRHFYERRLDVPELKHLTLNFRSSGSIVELSNILLELKEKYLGIKSEELQEEWKYKGRPVTIVSGINENDMLEILNAAGAKRTILVRTETQKRRLKKRLATELIFTLKEAKGLEFDTVVLWKFCEDQFSQDVWKVILELSKRSIHEAEVRHEINLLYVGITRSQKDLIIYDGKIPSLIWENQQLKNAVYITSDRSFIDGIWNVISTPQEWIEQGHYFFAKNYYKAAVECFKNGGDAELLSKASAYYYEKIGKYAEAALNFEKIGEISKAADNYEKAGEFNKALSLWKKLKNDDKLFNCRIEIYKKEGKFHKAGSLYLEKRKYKRAVECFNKAGDYKKIAELYLKKLKNLKEAAKYYEYSHDLGSAADLYFRQKSYAKAADLYFRDGNNLKAETLWKRTKNTARLLELYEKTGQNEKRFRIYEKQKNFAKAVKCLKALKDKSHLEKEAEELFTKRKYFQALLRFYVINNHKKTAECYFRMKKYEEAVKYFKYAEEKYLAGNAYNKIGDYRNALKSYLNSEKDRKNGYPKVKKMIGKIYDDDWIYKLALEFFYKKEYAAAAVLYSVFSNTFPEVGACYAKMKEKEKAFKAWNKCQRVRDYEQVADICIREDIVEIGADFILSRHKKMADIFDWIDFVDWENNKVIKLFDAYFTEQQNPDEMLIWGSFLCRIDFEGEIWEKILFYLEKGGDYNLLIGYFDNLKILENKRFKEALAKFKRDIPELKNSKSWDNLAFRYLLLDNIDEFNKILPKININERNYNYFLLGEKKHFNHGVNWCLENGLIHRASEILTRKGKFGRAAEVFEKAGNFGKAADYYLYAGQAEKSALLYKRLKRFSAAGDAYYKNKDYLNALKMYKRQTPQNKRKTAKTYERLQDIEKAMILWKEIGDKKSVARCTRKLEKKKQTKLQFK